MRIHVLYSERVDKHRLVIHTLVPAGNNAVGKTWKSVLLAAGEIGKTPVIYSDATEQTNILNGNVAEIELDCILNPNLISNELLNSNLETLAAQAITAWQNSMLQRYNYTGYALGTVV